MARRVIMHVDMDAFYASVELRRRPELRGTAVIVGGFPRGVVLSASYEARACGVRSGMASAQARQLAPRATFVDPDFDSYTAVSQAIAAVFGSVTSVVESASIDEAFLDITGSIRMFGSPTAIGEYVRAVVADEQQITCSVGIGPSKFVAKVGSRQAKPDGLIEVPAGPGGRLLASVARRGDVGRRSSHHREAAPAGHFPGRGAGANASSGFASRLRTALGRHAAGTGLGARRTAGHLARARAQRRITGDAGP